MKLKSKSGEAFKYGVYNTKTNSHAAVESAGMEIAGDEKYHAYGFRFDKLTPEMYWWVSPPGTGAVEAVYIDRFYFVRDEK